MKAKIAQLAMLVALTAGSVNVANAASSAVVTIKGAINTVTCDVKASQQTIQLPNMTPADVAAVGAFATGKTTDFSVSLNNCTGTNDTTSLARLQITGPTTATGETYFSDDASSPVAVGLALKSAPTTLLSNNSVQHVSAANDAANAIDGQKLELTAGVISSTATITSGHAVSAPITFTYVYN
ncbi:hypothetical protein BL250_09210 [Erwinia sp. OLTSP20]|uniref:fimbrial protein n=1 Tax=unclassified Erwinia TaxID=2622719 RepID=UPI000C17AF1C|nr:MULTISPECIES: type 1 fimbrial protein [unclassified Erwinia]PIJ50709.1 hypothetical protein BV501_06885 [Erwinia sp. OAMSP11]PIJ75379.1 hypothetical protein BK416_01685 [Erwinia sp. OLSSP12]PIJ81877.1 hypothetical protein BLD47_07235 [Erwinia sp. OLCASP19]PIJ84532.1 hypothetical protein BLD46_07325 [Erwinia sp. OLMTSP26]PIJ86879.1 hypothetical protein BLD49_07095 [Erwinia sp. OLMDSP33]